MQIFRGPLFRMVPNWERAQVSVGGECETNCVFVSPDELLMNVIL